MSANRVLQAGTCLLLLGLSGFATEATALSISSQSFKAENRITVTPSGGSTFSAERRDGGRGAWCAAGDYARTVLGAAGTQRIYIADVATKDRNAVHFTLNSAGLTPVSVFSVGASVKQPGANLSVDHAYGFCADFKLINRG